MTLSQLPLLLSQQHRNQQLFSDHYLNSTLPMRSERRALVPDASVALSAIAPIVCKFVQAPSQIDCSLNIRSYLRFIAFIKGQSGSISESFSGSDRQICPKCCKLMKQRDRTRVN